MDGLHVVPGLVDIHSHTYATPGHRNAWAGDNSILPDGFGFRFRVLDRFRTRRLACLDICGGRLASRQRLRCELTLLSGEVVWDWNGRSGRAWRETGPTCGLRSVDDLALPPTRK